MPKTRLISPGIANHSLKKNLQLDDNWISNDGGDEGIRITDAGLVGIGTDSPSTFLHVKDGTSNASFHADAKLIIEDDGNAFFSTMTGTTDSAGILFGISGKTGAGQISYKHDDNYMYFVTDEDERMRIDSSGNVGIGTSPGAGFPDKRLSIISANAAGTLSLAKNTSDETITADEELGTIFFGGDDPTDAAIGFQYGASISGLADAEWGTVNGSADTTDCPTKLVFNTADDATNTLDARMTIRHNGNIGIGVTDPDELLEVAGDLKISGANKLYLYDTGGEYLESDGTDLDIYSGGNIVINNSEGGTLLIDKNHSSTTATTIYGMLMDLDKTGTSSSNNTIYGVLLDLDNTTATGGTNNMYGIYCDSRMTFASGSGTASTYGAKFIATGSTTGTTHSYGVVAKAVSADTNTGVQIECAGGQNHIKMVDSTSVLDNATISLGSNSHLTIATVDYVGTVGHITLDADGDITLDAAGGDVNVLQADLTIPVDKKVIFGNTGEYIVGDDTDLDIISSNDATIDAEGDIILDANGGNISLLDGGSTYTPSAASDATTKTYVDTQTVITANAYSRLIDGSTWSLFNNDSATTLGGTDITVGDTETLTMTRIVAQSLVAIIPYNMTVHAVSFALSDDDMTAHLDKRLGIWRLPSLGTAGSNPGNASPNTYTLAYISTVFGGTVGKVQALYDTSADFELTAGDGIFMGYLNEHSGGNDDCTVTMSIWAHQTTP